MIKTYWLRILVCGIAAAILGYVIGLITPKQYDAVVQIMVAPYEPGGSRYIGSEADQAVADLLDSSAARSVDTQVDVLTSNGVLLTAAEKVGKKWNLSYTKPDDDLYIGNLQDRVSVNAQRQSDLVTLRVRMTDPDLAADLAKEIETAFEDQNFRQSREAANRAVDFLSAQTDTIKAQLAAIDAATAKEKTESGVTDIKLDMQSDVVALKELSTNLDTAKKDVATSVARGNDLRSQLAGQKKTMKTVTQTSANPKYEQLISSIAGAEADRAAALEHYLPDSEQVKSVDRRLKQLRTDLAATKPYKEAGSTEAPNPLYMSLKNELALNDAGVQAAQGELRTAQAAYDAKLAEMAKLPELERKLTDLERKQAVLERISQLYTSKLKTLEYGRTARRATATVISPAFAFPKPTVPNFQLNVGLGLFLGLAIGFLWSIGTEAKKNPIRSLGQLNRLALQPCYRVVPELRVPMRGLNRAPAEVFDSLLANFIRSEKKGYRLGVLGVTKNAGATTTAMNLAIAAARGGYSVLYVEVDPGNNALTKLTPAVGDVKSPGANISIFNASLGETTSGGAVGLPEELNAAAEGKDLVIFDFSPVKVSGDAFLVANQLDEMILLVRANVTRSVDFLQAQQALIDAGCPMVTVSLARVQDQSDDISALEQQADIKAIPPQA